MEITGVSKQTVPFVLLVNSHQCATRKEFQMDKKNKYKYYVIGRNHFAYAWVDLAKANLHLDSVH
jgi:hypothetical protein